MSLSEVLTRRSQPAIPSSVPNTNYVESAINRIFDRWPDINPEAREEDHEKILGQLYDIITTDSWQDVKTSFVISGFNIAFIDRYKNRNDVRAITDFAFNELKATTKPSIVNALMRIYSSTFSLNSDNTEKLGEILNTKTELLGQKWRRILSKFPDYLVSEQAPETIADSMISMENPWVSLKQVGMNDPFASGIMDYAHEAYVTRLAPDLDNQETIERLFEWLIPETGKNKTTGNVIVVEALIDHWLNQTPPEPIRQYITENLISLYDDPRIRPERWNTVDQKYKDVLFGWLTKEDLRFFTSVVDSTQTDPMWVPRRDFWLKLYDEDLIDQAWVAFCPGAERYARQHLSTGRVGLSANRFARQTGRPDTSILILKIGTKIFVDGCHNYSTHVWNTSDPVAPPLFKAQYNCDNDLRMKSPVGRGKSHSSIPSWSAWVREMIYASIPNSSKQPVDWDSPRRNFNTAKSSSRNEPSRIQSNDGYDFKKLVPDRFDITLNDIKSEMAALQAQLLSENFTNFRLNIVFSRVAANKNLSTVEREAVRKLFDNGEVRPSDFPMVNAFLQPIFLLANGEPNFDLWLSQTDKIEQATQRYRMKLSPKASNAISKMKRQRTALDKGEANALEHLLQSLRAIGASIDDLLR